MHNKTFSWSPFTILPSFIGVVNIVLQNSSEPLYCSFMSISCLLEICPFLIWTTLAKNKRKVCQRNVFVTSQNPAKNQSRKAHFFILTFFLQVFLLSTCLVKNKMMVATFFFFFLFLFFSYLPLNNKRSWSWPLLLKQQKMRGSAGWAVKKRDESKPDHDREIM